MYQYLIASVIDRSLEESQEVVSYMLKVKRSLRKNGRTVARMNRRKKTLHSVYRTLLIRRLNSQAHTTVSSAYKDTHTHETQRGCQRRAFSNLFLYFDFRTPNPIKYFKILYFVHEYIRELSINTNVYSDVHTVSLTGVAWSLLSPIRPMPLNDRLFSLFSPNWASVICRKSTVCWWDVFFFFSSEVSLC